nr:trehalose-phosphate phosphatase B-like isoform X2 [Nicotiana tomentosiformis]
MGLSRLSSTEGENAFSIEYTSWLMEHPSALDKLEQMMSIAKGRKIVIFLDYDGTLSDIVPNPEEAFMTDKVQDFVQLNNVYYAGSHGLDIEAPLNQTTNFDDMDNEVVVLHQPAKEFLPEKHKVLNLLSERTKGIKGVNIEDNKFCISVHYRHVHAKDLGTLENVISTVLKEYQNFRLSKGKKVFEIRPNIGWNKGHALEYFLENLGFGSSDDVLPIYIGDDRTDEDAFNVLRKMGQGLPIVVSATPKDTKALYSLREPKDVMEFLLGLVQR